jgi:hypothetical protein
MIIQEAKNGNKKCFEMKRGEFATEESEKSLINYPLMIQYHAVDGAFLCSWKASLSYFSYACFVLFLCYR